MDFSKISDFLLTKLSEFAYLSDALYWHLIPDDNSSGFPDGQKNIEPGRAGNTPAKTPRQLKKTRRYACIPFYFVLFECAGIARDVPSSLPATTPEPGALRRGPSPSSRSAGLPPARHPPPAARAVPLPDGSCHCRERSLPAPPSARSDRDGDGGLAKETETLRTGRLKAQQLVFVLNSKQNWKKKIGKPHAIFSLEMEKSLMLLSGNSLSLLPFYCNESACIHCTLYWSTGCKRSWINRSTYDLSYGLSHTMGLH